MPLPPILPTLPSRSNHRSSATRPLWPSLLQGFQPRRRLIDLEQALVPVDGRRVILVQGEFDLPASALLAVPARRNNPSHSPPKVAAGPMLASMAKSPGPLCLLTTAHLIRKVAGTGHGPWIPRPGNRLPRIRRSSGPSKADFDNAPFRNDVLATVRYGKTHGCKTVPVIGSRFGGAVAGDASIQSVPGEMDRIDF